MINILTFAIIRDIAFYLFHPVIAAHECYYMYWGNNLKIKYYDHPFITGLLSSYTRKNNIYIKRLPYLILTILTNILVYLIYDKILIDQQNKLNCFFLYTLLDNPYPIATVDKPFKFMWIYGIYTSLNIIQTKSNVLSLFPLTFIGLCTKYNFVLIFLVWFIISLYDTSFFYNSESYISIFSLLIFYTPFLINNFQSYIYQFKHLTHKKEKSLTKNKFSTFNFFKSNLFFILNFILFFLYDLDFDHFKSKEYKIIAISYLVSIFSFFFIINIFKKVRWEWHFPLYNIFYFTFINFNFRYKIITLSFINIVRLLYAYNINFILKTKFGNFFKLNNYSKALEIIKDKDVKIVLSDKYNILAFLSFYRPDIKVFTINEGRLSEFYNKNFLNKLSIAEREMVNDSIKKNGYFIYKKDF